MNIALRISILLLLQVSFVGLFGQRSKCVAVPTNAICGEEDFFVLERPLCPDSGLVLKRFDLEGNILNSCRVAPKDFSFLNTELTLTWGGNHLFVTYPCWEKGKPYGIGCLLFDSVGNLVNQCRLEIDGPVNCTAIKFRGNGTYFVLTERTVPGQHFLEHDIWETRFGEKPKRMTGLTSHSPLEFVIETDAKGNFIVVAYRESNDPKSKNEAYLYVGEKGSVAPRMVNCELKSLQDLKVRKLGDQWLLFIVEPRTNSETLTIRTFDPDRLELIDSKMQLDSIWRIKNITIVEGMAWLFLQDLEEKDCLLQIDLQAMKAVQLPPPPMLLDDILNCGYSSLAGPYCISRTYNDKQTHPHLFLSTFDLEGNLVRKIELE